jgi:hypothetical protein
MIPCLLPQFIRIDFLGLVNGCQGIVKKITSLDLMCASILHQLCLFSATDIQVFIDSLIIQGDCLKKFNRSSHTRSGGNWSVLDFGCSCDHKMGQQNWEVAIKNTITTYLCMGYYNQQELRNYSWRSNNLYWEQGFFIRPFFCCNFLSQTTVWYSFPHSVLQCSAGYLEILWVGLATKTCYQINENAGIWHRT